MEYLKLIALQIDDFSSFIFFEDNYALNDIEDARKDKTGLELKGYLCVLVNVTSKMEVLDKD